MNITQNQYQEWSKLLRDIPVSINNFYGDPLIQWNDTLEKLNSLLETNHTGPIGIITKGKFNISQAKAFSELRKKGLNIIILISISELPQYEKIGMKHRYENITLLNKYEIPNIAYIRPLTPPYNTSKEIIENIFKKLNKAGAKVIIASGFRGDDSLVAEMSPDEKVEWAMRVKIMTKDVYNYLKEYSEKYDINFFTRTACAVSYLSGLKMTYNPYYYSPNLVKCDELKCPLRQTCKPILKPKDGSLEFIKFLGYDAEVVSGKENNRCCVEADNRLSCPSCCTTCYILNVPRILIKNKNVKLGDLTFIRFLTGMLAMKPDLRDGGDKEVGYVNLPNYNALKDMQCLNSWWPYARIGDTCFDCKYCIEKYYGTNRKEYGFPPGELLEKIIKINSENLCHINIQKNNMAALSSAATA